MLRTALRFSKCGTKQVEEMIELHMDCVARVPIIIQETRSRGKLITHGVDCVMGT